METSDMRLDGNALGGSLLAVFGVEMTVAVATCAACGATGEVARLVVYVQCPGIVARCPVCGAVVLRVVESRERIWLDLSGARTLEMARPD
jgi:predicted RNA-binding Zn-ribbon protein involved in translation (DUF1610 family)